MLVAVYPGVHPIAVWPPGYVHEKGFTSYDWREKRGSARNNASVGAHGQVMTVDVACATRWKTHAMMTAYVLRGCDGNVLDRQPRIAKEAADWIEGQGYRFEFHVLILEGDNPGHGRWTLDGLEAWEEQRRTSPWLARALTYTTTGGWRAIWPLTSPIVVPSQYEDATHGMLAQMHREGLEADDGCLDFVHMFGPPRVVRAELDAQRKPTGRKVTVGEAFDITLAMEHVVPVDPRELPPLRRARVYTSKSKTGAARPDNAGDAWEGPDPVAFARDCPPIWTPRVQTIAAACLAVHDTWHALFLALSGALCERKVAPEVIPAVVEAVSRATGNDTKTGDRRRGAQSTVTRFQNGESIAGWDALVMEYPAVADAVDEATDGSDLGYMARKCRGPKPDLPPPEEAQQQIRTAVESAPRGTSVVVVNCGVGKTDNTLESAAIAAARNPDAERAPPGSKTALAFPTNQKATEAYEALVKLGARVRRIYSPLAHKEPGAESFACVHVEAGRALAAGGQSVRREFCDGPGRMSPCEMRSTCPAYLGAEGVASPRVVVGTHALLDELADHAGTTGKLVIDESPAPVTVEHITLADLAKVSEQRGAFYERFPLACSALIEALRAALEDPEIEFNGTFADLVVAYKHRIHPLAVREAAEAAGWVSQGQDLAGEALRAASDAGVTDQGPREAPTLKPTSAVRARQPDNRAYALAVGRASGVLRAIHLASAAAIAGEAPHHARIERDKDGVATLVLIAPNYALVRALRRDGATVVLDATPDIEVLSRLAGADLEAAGRVTRCYAGEKAAVERTLLGWKGGTRKWLFHRKGLYATQFGTVVRSVVRWALEDPSASVLGLITFARAELVLSYAMQPTERQENAVARIWAEQHKLDPANLRECAAAVRPFLYEWTGSRASDGTARTIQMAHYGGLRGLNRMKGVHALATIGDPWNELESERQAASYLGVKDWEALYVRKTAEEIAQAQGRLRSIWRAGENLRALHAGWVLASDPLWTGGVTFRRLPAHRPSADAAMTPEQLRAALDGLSLRKAAALLGVSKPLLGFYLRGDRRITPEFSTRVENWKRAAGSSTEGPTNRSKLVGRFVDGASDLTRQPEQKSWTETDAQGWLETFGDPPPDVEW